MLSESEVQRMTFEWICAQFPFVTVVKIDNEGKRSTWGHSLAIKLGLKRGASDWFIAYPSNGYSGLWIEFKKEGWKGPSGKKEKEHVQRQIDFIQEMRSQGYAAEICIGFDESIKCIKDYLCRR